MRRLASRVGLQWCRVTLPGLLVSAAGVMAAESPRASPPVEVIANLPYAATTNPRQTLDLYLPRPRAGGARLPVVVFVHGGGWGGGSKAAGRALLEPLVASGDYAGVSVGYRLSGEAAWPAQIHDCKAAIRWVRAQAGRFRWDPERIGVMGDSAGGTLATLLGTSGGLAALEGTEGPHPGVSSRVACVVNRFGRLNFLAEPASARAGPGQIAALAVRMRTLFRDAGTGPEEMMRLASPLTHVGNEDPPVLTLHGTNDTTVPIVQAEEFDAAARRAGLSHLLVRVVGAGHGLNHPEEKRRTRLFLDRHLRGGADHVSTEPILARPRR